MRAIAAGLFLCLFAALPATADLAKDELRELETLLARLGFDPGPVDGVADAQTAAAIESYQTFAALRVDGVASQALLHELRGVTDSLGAAEAKSPSETTPTSPEKVSAPDDEEDPAGRTAEAASPPPAASIGDVADMPWQNAVHLASFRQQSKAEEEWRRLQQRLPHLLGDMDAKIDEIDLAGEGLFFRLYAGPFPNQATAQDFCGVLSLEGYNCGVARGALQVAAPGPPLSDGAGGQDEPALAAAEPEAAVPAEEPPAGQIATATVEPTEEAPAAEPQTPGTPPPIMETPAMESTAVETPAPEPPAPETPAPETPAPETPQAAGEPAVGEPAAEEPAVEAAAVEEAAAIAAPEDVAELPSQPESEGEGPSEVPSEAAQVAAAPTAEEAGAGALGTPTALVASAQFAEAGTGESGTAVGAPLLLVPETRGSAPTVLIAASQFASVSASGGRAAEVAPEGLEESAPPALAEPDAGEAQAAQETGEAIEPLAAATVSTPAPDAPQSASLAVTGAEDYAAATAAFEVGDCENALQSYAQALEKGGLPRRQVSAGYNNRGRCLYDLARYYEALTELNKAIGLDRAFAAAYYNRGRVHNALGNSAKARSDLKAAYDLGFGRLRSPE